MHPRPIIAGLLVLAIPSSSAHAQQGEADCKRYAPPAKLVRNLSVGIGSCRIISEKTVFNIEGHRFRRVEIRVDGTADGWAIKKAKQVPGRPPQGRRYIYFNDGPDFVYAQSGNTGKRYRGIGRYEAARGSGLTILYPEQARNWNGKLFVTAHGAGAYRKIGTLVPRDPDRKFNPLLNANRYVGLMIDKGYAVAHTMRSSSFKGDVTVKLEDGSTVQGYNLSSNAGLIRSWIRLAENFIADKRGQVPRLTYWYGFSAGGMLGRLINYHPGYNKDEDGGRIIDGFLMDDSGGGLWLPEMIVDGKDVLFAKAEQRAEFTKQIDVTHGLYTGLENKRRNAVILKNKGLGEKHRVYEIRGVSHFDAGGWPWDLDRGRDSIHQKIDLGGLMDALIDRLNRWVENGTPPPQSKADVMALGDADGDGQIENPAVALPEVTCPLGFHHVFPAKFGKARFGGMTTAFAAFDGINQEPVDGKGRFVDMNRSKSRDRRESVTEAWRRLGLLKPDESFSRARYVECVADSVSKLVGEGLLPAKVAEYYLERANSVKIGAF